MQVNLKWVLIVSIILSVLGYLVGIGAQLTDLGLSDHEVKAVIAIFAILLGVGNSINTVLVAFGMNTPSRLASASLIGGVKGFQVAPELADVARKAVGDNATITTTKS